MRARVPLRTQAPEAPILLVPPATLPKGLRLWRWLGSLVLTLVYAWLLQGILWGWMGGGSP